LEITHDRLRKHGQPDYDLTWLTLLLASWLIDLVFRCRVGVIYALEGVDGRARPVSTPGYRPVIAHTPEQYGSEEPDPTFTPPLAGCQGLGSKGGSELAGCIGVATMAVYAGAAFGRGVDNEVSADG
jgi:hypothetical protein